MRHMPICGSCGIFLSLIISLCICMKLKTVEEELGKLVELKKHELQETH